MDDQVWTGYRTHAPRVTLLQADRYYGSRAVPVAEVPSELGAFICSKELVEHASSLPTPWLPFAHH